MTSHSSPDRAVVQPLPWANAPDGIVRLSPDPAVGLGPNSAALLGLVRISGEQAASFLHGQLTQDVTGLPEGQARWAGYCSARGRLSATARLWRSSEGYWLAVSADLAAGLAKRLSMFVLRAKAKVQDCSADWVVFGVMGAAAHTQVQHWLQAGGSGLDHDSADAVVCTDGGMQVGLPAISTTAGPLPRSLLIVSQERLASVPADWLNEQSQGLQHWQQAEVLAAIPRINSRTADCFVPQMVNFESVDGVNFTKGCYPGQEVVARSQYLGKLRRRMFLAQGQGLAPEPASDLTIPGEAEPAGQFVMSAATDEGFIALFECRTDRADQVGLQLLPLPYPLRAQE